MKAALEAWGADSNLFHQGATKENGDPDVIAATMAKPGVVLRRPLGSDGSFSEHADLPTHLGEDTSSPRPKKSGKPNKSPRPMDAAAERKANLAFEKEQVRRESERRKEEAARAKERKLRQHAIDKAQEAFTRAKRIYEEKVVAIDAERDALEKRSQSEDERWALEKKKPDSAMRGARD
jgi:hypothetical protein